MPPWKLWLIRGCLLAVLAGAVYVWPEGVLAVVAGFAIVVIVCVWWIKRKIKGFIQPLEQIADAFRGKIELIPKERINWHHAERMSQFSEDLAGRGFEHVGDFVVGSSEGQHLRAWVNVAESIYAAAYDLEFADPHIDFVTPFADGSYITYSTFAHPELFERPPDMPIERLPGLPALAALDKMLQALPDKPRATVSREGFVPCVEEYAARESAWRQARYERDAQRQQQLQEAFLSQSGWSAIDWDRDQHRVFFVHDELPPDEIVDAYINGLHNLDDETHHREQKRARQITERATPRAAFAELVQAAPPTVSFEKLAELSAPVAADVYRCPDSEADV